jgi:hypothetical protein
VKHVRVKNLAILIGYGLFVFVCGMAYEHYTSAYVAEELCASVTNCPPVGVQLRAHAL